jgi:putative hemolysin
MFEQAPASEFPSKTSGKRGGRDRTAVSASSGTLLVRLAESEAEVRAAQALRYRIFYEEKRATPSPAMVREKRDFDPLDDAADHLLVIDTTQRETAAAVVGTYRLLRSDAVGKGGFYSCAEFDLSRLESWPGEVLELGRSCVDPAHRSGRAINLLWRGIAAYLTAYGTDLLFGCGSLPGTDPEKLKLPLAYMHHHHLAPRHIRASALPERYVDMNMLDRDAIDRDAALAEIPPLIKGYLRLGGFVGDGAVVDDDFNCTDVCIIVQASLLTTKYARHYGCEVSSLNAA